ncbi:MAG: lipopolysaccharide biosynthesis protein [Acidobacteriota bacterium]|nr:lipopolysaccharide biosynthesis protein [Acidobacteriota bacterium]
MANRRLLLNAGMSVVQVIALSVLLWLLYRFLLHTVGVELLGVWSLTLAAAVAARAGDLGFSASVVKYVAAHLAREDETRAAQTVETAALSAGALTALISIVAFPLLRWGLAKLLTGDALAAAESLLPYALGYLCLSSVAGVFQSALDGCQQISIRSLLVIAGETVHLALCYWLVNRHGLLGLAYARLAQTAIFLTVSWVVLKRFLPGLGWLPIRWRLAAFREMMVYGLNAQIVWLVSLLHDPLTKSLLVSFGGTALVGYYEMASRLVSQLRTAIIAANQSLVPVIAGSYESQPDATARFYRESYRLLFFFGVPLFALLTVSLPIVSELWIGSYERRFVICGTLLAAGWFGNLLSAPAYFVNMGTGDLRWNTASHLVLGVLNLAFGWLLGRWFGGFGVAAASALALIGGGTTVIAAYHRKQNVPSSELLPADSWRLIVFGFIGLLAGAAIYHHLRVSIGLWPVAGLVTLIGGLLIAIPAWFHPMRKRLSDWISRFLLSGK